MLSEVAADGCDLHQQFRGRSDLDESAAVAHLGDSVFIRLGIVRRLEGVALVVLALVAACEPETITEAREQLDRGGVRTVMFSFPIANDTLTIAQFLPEEDTVTTSSGLIGVTVDVVTVDALILLLSPSLSVSVESSQEVDNDAFAFDDFEDVIRDATLNDVTASLILTNTADIPVVLESGFVLGAAELDATGAVKRDPITGDPDFLVNGAGVPILIPVVDPGMTTLSIGRLTTTTVELDVAPLADRVVKLALDDIRLALVMTGTATAGAGNPGNIVVQVDVGFVVGLDLTLPASGVTFSVSEVESAGELDPADADAVAGKLVNATITFEVINGTPFGMVVEFAYVAGDRGDTTDVFLEPDRVVLNTVSVAAPNVDANGLVIQPISDATVLTVDSAQVRGLLGDIITTTVRIKLLPGSGGGGRGAVRATDEIVIRARAEIELRGGT